MESYTPETKELLENRIEFLTGQVHRYRQNITDNEKEINRLNIVYNERYGDTDVYLPETGNPWAI